MESLSLDELNNTIDKAELDAINNRGKDVHDLKNEINSWAKKVNKNN